MSTYVIAGASQGIGYAFITYLAANPDNTVFGLVRTDAPATIAKLKAANLDYKNLHILQADITSLTEIKAAVAAISAITPAVDTLIFTAGYRSYGTISLPPTAFKDEETVALLEADTNESMKTAVVGITLTINAFLPLIRAGKGKKIVGLSSPSGDIECILKMAKHGGGVHGVPYSTGKAAQNLLLASFAVELMPEGIVVVSMSPGFVATERTSVVPQEVLDQLFPMWKKVWPDFDMKAATPEEAVKRMINTIENVITMEQTGEHLSFKGNKDFL
ncbi:hypothetical protein Dda_4556 [Drechslerella dactyloides]|uniref:NAD(P)-binding protein n=1 Tax=Drechslerella dactyloides TaxID=74499 RepID=A0AAD6IXJ4_DREDA|nr:hypothetical protein Dda_4556 [Drechslerella dactyloides]